MSKRHSSTPGSHKARPDSATAATPAPAAAAAAAAAASNATPSVASSPPSKKHASEGNRTSALSSAAAPAAAAAAAASSSSAHDHDGDAKMGAPGVSHAVAHRSSLGLAAASVGSLAHQMVLSVRGSAAAATLQTFKDQLQRAKAASSASSSSVSLDLDVLEAQMRLWQQQLLPEHSNLIRSQGDCLLDSVLFLIHVREGNMAPTTWLRDRAALADKLRAEAITWLRANEHFQTPVGVLNLLRWDMNESWSAMCTRLAANQAWLETPALQAIATILKRDIALFLSTTHRNGGMTAFFASGRSNEASPSPLGPLALANFHLRHFVPVVPWDETLDGTAFNVRQQEKPDASKRLVALSAAALDRDASGSRSACAWVSEQFDLLLGKIKELDDKLRTFQPPLPLGLDLFESQIRSMQAMLDNEFVIGILGTNGAGKSYLLNMLLYVTMMESAQYTQDLNSFDLEAWNELVAERTAIGGSANSQLVAMDGKRDTPILQFLGQDSTQQELQQSNVIVQQMSVDEQARRQQTAVREQEQEVFESIVRSYHAESGDPTILRAYLLPSMDVGQVTTKCLIRVKFGHRFQILVKYLTEREAKETAFQLVALIQEMQGPDKLSEADWERVKAELPVAKQRFSMLTGIPCTKIALNHKLKGGWQQTAPLREWKDQAALEGVPADYPLPTTADDISLSESIRPVLGRTLILVGSGAKDIDVDRTWIRDQLDLLLFGCSREFVKRENSSDWQTHVQADRSKEAHAIASITLFVPARVLESGLCLLDMPGTNEKNAMSEMMTKQGLEESNVLMLLTGRTLSADEATVNVLTQSSFLRDSIAMTRAPLVDAAAAGLASVDLSASLPVPQFGQLVHVHCPEKTRPVSAKKLFDQLSGSYEDVPVSSEMQEVLQQSAKGMRNILHQIFSAHKAAARAAANAGGSDDDDNNDDDDDDDVLTAQQLANFNAAADKCSQLAVYPSLFASVALNADEVLKLPSPSDENRARLLRATGLGNLLGKLRNTGVRQAAYMLEQICSTGAAVATLHEPQEEDAQEEECKDSDQADAPVAAAAAAAPSPVAAVLSVGPIPRLIRELRSVLANRQESEPSRVHDMKTIAEIAMSLQGRNRQEQKVNVETYMLEADKLCSALRKDTSDMVNAWFAKIWARDNAHAIRMGQADIEERGQGLQNSNKRSVLAPYMSGLTPAFKIRESIFRHPLSRPNVEELAPILNGRFERFQASVSQLLTRWAHDLFGKAAHASAHFQALCADLSPSPGSEWASQLHTLLQSFWGAEGRTKARDSMAADKLLKQFRENAGKAMKEYLTDCSAKLVTVGPPKIRETLSIDVVTLLDQVWLKNRAVVQERVRKAFKPFVGHLCGAKGILAKCIYKIINKAAATVGMDDDDDDAGESPAAAAAASGPSVVCVLEEYSDVFDHWLRETTAKLPLIRELSLNDDSEGMAVVTRSPPPPPPPPSPFEQKPTAQADAKKRKLMHLITANKFPMPFNLKVLPVSARPMTLPTAWILQRMKADDRHQKYLDLITELKPVPVTPAAGVSQLRKEMFPHRFQPCAARDLGHDNLLMALATQIIGQPILKAQTTTLSNMCNLLRTVVRWHVSSVYHTAELHQTFEELFGRPINEYLTMLQDEIMAEERSRPASPAITHSAAAAASSAASSSAHTDAASCSSPPRIWYGILELALLCHVLDIEVWLWGVDVHPHLTGIAEPVRIVRKIQHSNTSIPLHIGLVHHQLAPALGQEIRYVFVPITMLGANTNEISAAKKQTPKAKGKGTKSKNTR